MRNPSVPRSKQKVKDGLHAIMAGSLKKSTGLTGLAVSKAPHHTLGILYAKILRVLQKIPESAAYRQHTERIVCERADVLKNCSDVQEVEKNINCGQVEELIVQAENELLLARKMVNWKAWEPLLKEAPPNQWTWPPVQSKDI